jgi:phenylalanyl-tRNA synthetase beta chain
VGLFEAGTVFFADPDPAEPLLPLQYDRLAWAIVGDVGLRALDGSQSAADAHFSLAMWRHVCAVMGLETQLEAASPPGYHPGRAAAVIVEGVVIGHVGELSPAAGRAFGLDERVAMAELDLAPILAARPTRPAVTPSVFPHVDFDLSFLVDADLPAADLVSATTGAVGELVESARVFDEFRDESLGSGTKALAVRYRLRAPDRTLEAKDIAAFRQSMIDAAVLLGAKLRGAE